MRNIALIVGVVVALTAAAQDRIWDFHMEAGSKYQASGNWKQAEREYFAAVKLAEAAPARPERLARSYASLGGAYVAGAKYEQAVAIFDLLLSGSPSPPSALVPGIRLSKVEAFLGLARYEDAEQAAVAAAEAARSEPKDGAQRIVATTRLAQVKRLRGKFAVAETLLAGALADAEKTPSATAALAAVLQALADVYRDTGRTAQARKFYLDAIEAATRAGGAAPLMAAAHEGLAALDAAEGRWVDAKQHLDRALAICRNSFGADHPETAQALLLSGALSRDQRQFQDAREKMQQALAIQTNTFEADHPSIAATRFHMAQALVMEGQFDKAKAEFDIALRIRTRVLGPGHPDVAAVKDALAGLYRAQGLHKEAEDAFRSALALREAALGRSHPEVARTRQRLAAMFAERHDYASAEALYREALTAIESSEAAGSLLAADLQHNFAALLQSQSKYDESEKRFLAALEIRKRITPGDPSVRAHQRGLTSLYLEQHEYAKAAAILEPLLETVRVEAGAESLEYDVLAGDLALAYQGVLRWPESERLLRQQLEARRKRGGETVEVAATLVDLGTIGYAQGKFEEARSNFEQALQLQSKLQTPAVSRATVHFKLGQTATAVGDWKAARDQFEQCLAIRTKHLPAGDPEVILTVMRLGDAVAAAKDWRRAEELFLSAASQIEKTRGNRDPELARALLALSTARQNAGNPAAESDARRALEIFSASGPERAETASAHLAIARSVALQGRFKDSLAECELARGILERVSGLHSESLLPVLEEIAGLQRRRSQTGDAEAALRQALSIQEKLPHTDPLKLSNTLNELALTLAQRGDFTGAEKHYRRSLALLESSGGNNRINTAASQANLGDLYRAMKRYDAAAKQLSEARSTLAPLGDFARLPLADIQEKSAALALDRRRFKDAEKDYRDALLVYEAAAGPANAHSARVLGGLARLYQEAGDYGKAHDHFTRALSMHEQVFGPDAPELVPLLENYAFFLKLRKRDAEAVNARRRAAAIRLRAGLD